MTYLIERSDLRKRRERIAMVPDAPVASDAVPRARRISQTRHERFIICRLGSM
jgi:hypothetical protein